MTYKLNAHFIFVFMILLSSLAAHAHAGHHHGLPTQAAKTADAKPDQRAIYKEIEFQYVHSIAPIFESKCANCHSANSKSPWYASIPGLHQWIEGDRREAKVHLEISKGFPFAGHGEPIEDLKAIEDAATNATMPPKVYAFFHPESRLTEMEKNRIVSWAGAGQQKMMGLKSK